MKLSQYPISAGGFSIGGSYANEFEGKFVLGRSEEGQSWDAGVSQLEQILMSWSSHVKSWTGAPDMRLHVMRYEDMLAKPFKTFSALSGFLGLPVEPERVKRAIRFSAFRELEAQEDKDGFAEARPDGKAKFFRSGKAGGWRKALSQQQVAQLIEAHHKTLIEFGYLTDDGRPAA